mgnify:CR=1 FL=1
MRSVLWAVAVLCAGSVRAEDAAKHPGQIKELSAELATTLVAGGKGVHLPRLASLSPTAAKALAACRGELSLDGLPELGSEAAAGLERYEGRLLSLDGISSLTPDAAGGLAKCGARPLRLNGLGELPAEVAERLAAFKGGLILGGLTRLDTGAAAALAARRGNVWLPKLEVLPSLGIARKVMECETEAGVILPPIAAFTAPDSVAIARYLAATKGPLALPHLRRISPKTLTALIEKRDVKIPPIETLELIPEPDGSPTEDFVIPEGFQAR